MKILVWHWGRRGAGPRFAAELSHALNALPGIAATLSLPKAAEILSLPDAPACGWPVQTYTGLAGLAGRCLSAPFLLPRLDRHLAALLPDLAICAMPAMLDPLMFLALRRRAIPSVVIAHDAAPHPGDGGRARAGWNRATLRRADAVAVLTRHVRASLAPIAPAIQLCHPPFPMPPAPPPRAHGGALRVLSFGRMRAYKGLDLLAATLRLATPDWDVRVIGAGPALADLPGARVENRYVAEVELPQLFAWADVVLLTHRAASQSGVAAMALGAGRFVVATAVGGLVEQLAGMPGAVLCPPDPGLLAAALRALPFTPPAPIDARAAWRGMAASLLAQANAAGLGRTARSEHDRRNGHG